jgi:F-type H+-transporting ATPase subunit a
VEGGFGPYVVFKIGEIPISQTVTTTWFLMAVIFIFVFLATRKMQTMPKGAQVVAEIFVDSINGLTKQTMGESRASFAPYIGTLIIFIAMANLSGLVGLRPPTADLNTTLALSMMTFFLIHFNGIRKKGIGTYAKGFLEPFPLLLPINIIGELATPVSLGFRLFGNITGGMVIMWLLYGALGGLSSSLIGLEFPIFQVGVPAVLHIYFDLFSGVLQSFIFTMLTMVFVSIAMD